MLWSGVPTARMKHERGMQTHLRNLFFIAKFISYLSCAYGQGHNIKFSLLAWKPFLQSHELSPLILIKLPLKPLPAPKKTDSIHLFFLQVLKMTYGMDKKKLRYTNDWSDWKCLVSHARKAEKVLFMTDGAPLYWKCLMPHRTQSEISGYSEVSTWISRCDGRFVVSSVILVS